jgi:hypothetical protein
MTTEESVMTAASTVSHTASSTGAGDVDAGLDVDVAVVPRRSDRAGVRHAGLHEAFLHVGGDADGGLVAVAVDGVVHRDLHGDRLAGVDVADGDLEDLPAVLLHESGGLALGEGLLVLNPGLLALLDVGHHGAVADAQREAGDGAAVRQGEGVDGLDRLGQRVHERLVHGPHHADAVDVALHRHLLEGKFGVAGAERDSGGVVGEGVSCHGGDSCFLSLRLSSLCCVFARRLFVRRMSVLSGGSGGAGVTCP